MPLLFTLQYYSQCWNENCCPVWGRIHTSTRVVDTRTENKRSWQSIVARHMVTWRRNIHSLLTLAAEPSEPNVGAVVQPRGWPVSQGRADLGPLNGKAQPRVCTHCTFRKERAAGVVPAFNLLQKKKKRVKCTLLETQTPLSGVIDDRTRFFIYQGPDAQRILSVLVVFSIVELHYLSGERVFSYVYSVPVSQLKCKPCAGRIFVSVHNNVERLLTAFRW